MLNYVDQPTRRMHNFAQAKGMMRIPLCLSVPLNVIALTDMMDGLMCSTYPCTNIHTYVRGTEPSNFCITNQCEILKCICRTTRQREQQ